MTAPTSPSSVRHQHWFGNLLANPKLGRKRSPDCVVTDRPVSTTQNSNHVPKISCHRSSACAESPQNKITCVTYWTLAVICLC
jgi:hypothetical protein